MADALDDDRVLIRSGSPVTLLGGGPVAAEDLKGALALAPMVVAADGGGDVDLPDGLLPRAVIGDMDSLQGAPRLARLGVPLHHLAEQDTTDLEKCLYSVAAPLYLGIGFLGGRLDHHLAAMHALVRYGDRRIVLIGGADLVVHCGTDWAAELPVGTRFSLFPMAPVRVRDASGLRWHPAGMDFAPDRRIGTSNLTTGPVRLEFDRPGMLAILPKRHLPAVLRTAEQG